MSEMFALKSYSLSSRNHHILIFKDTRYSLKVVLSYKAILLYNIGYKTTVL